MKRIFRSRGFSVLKKEGYVDEFVVHSKVYYDPDFSIQAYPEICNLVDTNIIQMFEYSVKDMNEIDTLNFHVNLECNYKSCYNGLIDRQREIIDNVPIIFDDEFLNYTIGYRLNNFKICGTSYYFYPTKRKINRIGIKGIDNPKLIKQYIANLVSFMKISDSRAIEEIDEYIGLISKFRGISLTFDDVNNVHIKIYAKVNQVKIWKFLLNRYGQSLSEYIQYGDVVLAALRVNRFGVSGINFYFFK